VHVAVYGDLDAYTYLHYSVIIAYSMGQIVKLVFVCVSVCLSVHTLTVAFLD